MSALTIAATSIRQDAAGRFCLNDLHRAAGGEKRHQPSDWLRLQQTQDLLAEMSREAIPGIPGIESKQGLGTFAAKELVYSYAMWISPAFHLRVVRAYDAAMKPSGLNAANLSRIEILKLAMNAEEERLRLEVQVAEQAPRVAFADQMLASDGTCSIGDAAKTIGVKVLALYAALREKGILLRSNAPAATYVPRYLRESIRPPEVEPSKFTVSARVTAEGLEFLRRFVAKHPELFKLASTAV